ncbi:hypothetical protein HYP06_gp067 [Vibrio phage vB_VspP_pVa5]|uniref:Uncharacterized protein n=1 Tax=Vibrio phage vB_VspP_pVa5 TaxID=1913109 RepID=A0A1J0GV71_9CAUD|nr:hypothetical protein HYP06_gp067 [Vibrio phage vB_VspP_pVa5]APC46072.1 hypothetical protein vBVspPpVa5_0106 [Vibrio phage vB_VspP_pVa5]
MSKTYRAKPTEVEAFVYGGNEAAPVWFLSALRKRQVHLRPALGQVVVKTDSGKINYYDPKAFHALFESVDEAKDLNKDGVIDKREEAIETEVKKKRKPRKKKEEVKEEPTEE